jgi:thiol-disulfide isomerase/thioredoxin
VFSLQRLDGPPVHSTDLVGKPTLIAFWTPWCPVCKVESRNLSWAQRLVGDRARVLSIATGYDDVGAVRRYVRDHGVDYPVLLGGDDQARDFHVQAFPTVYFLDAQGRVKGSSVGYTTTLGLLARLLW